MNRLKNEYGAITLVETMLVLMIVSSVWLFPILTFQSYQEKIETDLFIEEVRNNITLMQNHAVFNGEPTEIYVDAERNLIDFHVRYQANHSLNYTLHPPDHVTILSNNRYRFKAHSGNIGRLSRARFKTLDGTYEFVFQLGSGRFYVQKI